MYIRIIHTYIRTHIKNWLRYGNWNFKNKKKENSIRNEWSTYVHLYKRNFFVKYISKLFIIVFTGQINWHTWHYTTFWRCTYCTLVKYNINSLKIPRYHLRNKMIDVTLLFSFLNTYVSVYKFVEITKVPFTYVILVRRYFISYC